MRRFLLAANWKMNSPPQGWDSEEAPYKPREDMDVVIFPTFLDIRTCLEKFLTVGAQYGRPEPKGAFSGDISMQILAEHGCRYVLCGHSERRKYHQEDDAFIASQVKAALAVGLHPIVCAGETSEEREAGKQQDIVERQLHLVRNQSITIAYEPVWAIGTGKSATPEQAQEMHAFIRTLLPTGHDDTRILYGGSVSAENANSLFVQPDIDGALIGGSSLDLKAFRAICDTAADAMIQKNG